MAHGVRHEWKSAAARRRPLLPVRSGGRPVVPRRRPPADLPTRPQTVHRRATVRSASSPRRADSGYRCLDRVVARRAPPGPQTSRRLDRPLEAPRQVPRALRAAPPGRRNDRSVRVLWPQPADRAPRRRLSVLTALPHVAAGTPPGEWGPASIYVRHGLQSDTGVTRAALSAGLMVYSTSAAGPWTTRRTYPGPPAWARRVGSGAPPQLRLSCRSHGGGGRPVRSRASIAER